ncbi:MAG: hypothetical protein AAF962_16900 [Actinomycetota bacterium]
MSTPRPRRRPRRGVLVALLLAALSVLAAACGQEAQADDRSVASLPAAGDTGSSDGTDGATDDDDSADTDTDTDDGDPADGEGDDGDEELTEEEAFLAFEQCMADKGIDTSALFGDAAGETIGGTDDDEDGAAALSFESDEEFEAFEAANEECGEILESAFGDFELTPEQEAAQRDAELQFSQCMADQGFAIDVNGSGTDGSSDDGGVVGFEIESDADIEALDAAFAQCEDTINEVLDDVYGDGEEEE